MKARFYTCLIVGILLALVQVLLIAFIKITHFQVIDRSKDNAYNFGTLLFFFGWSAAAIPLLRAAYRLNKKIIQEKFERDNFIK